MNSGVWWRTVDRVPAVVPSLIALRTAAGLRVLPIVSLGPPLCQKPSLQGFALRLQLAAAGGDAFCHLALTARIEPVLPVLGHIPCARHRLPMHRQRIAVWAEGRQLISDPRSPTLVPQSLVIGLRARGGMAENRCLATASTHLLLRRTAVKSESSPWWRKMRPLA